jgi:C1A family cysteine protease
MTHAYGYVPDFRDTRDFLYIDVATPIELPGEVDLRSLCSPVRDQGQLGSCTGFAGEALREFLLNRDRKNFRVLSPRFLYYEERVIEGTVHEDSGASIRDILKVLNKKGISHEDCCPYDISRFDKKPSLLAYLHALAKKIKAYHRLLNLQDVKGCIAQNKGVVIGFLVRESFETIVSDGKMPMPSEDEAILGGHAVFICGYKDDASYEGGGYFIVKNSWGTAWGDKGYFYMPYAAIVDMIDMWTGE